MTHPHPNRRFVPQAVLTRSGKINTAGVSVNTVVRPVNTAGSKPTVNHPRPISNAYKKGYSQVTRPFNKYSANKNSIFNKKVNTVRVKDTTARDRAVVSENKGKGVNAVKASACWVWKAKNSSASNTFKKYSYIDARGRSKATHNRRSTRKKELLTVVSLEFLEKLLDESQVLLRVPRNDNIYSGELTFFLGLQVQQKEDGIFISQDKYMAKILKKFNFSTVKTTTTPIETNKALVKDEEAKVVDVHLYRLIIGSLMYLTTSRPDIMFVVYACARFHVTPKMSYFHAVKRIFRYLKGQPKLGLWYPRDSSFDLEAFSDSDYAGASLDRKSTTGDETVYKECEDIMERAATIASSLDAKQDSGSINRTQSIATLNESFPQGTDSSSGPRHNLVLPVQVNAVEVDKKKVILTEISIRSDLNLEDAGGIDCLPTATIFEDLARMGRKQTKNTEVPHTSDSTVDVPNAEHVPTHSHDPQLSGEDRLKLTELMDMCTKLSEKVLDLEHTKTAQAQEITNLKLRVK
ncbi:uncharacterized mitochondrial protein-like protein [Tanacetum coccineum]|uniref:Uncharacterized mitochondrial protein-like protein n=1 Tax=Tanacetum coccineum TaxID=301880 RepID=A0ABQ5AZZ7_9ASTR